MWLLYQTKVEIKVFLMLFKIRQLTRYQAETLNAIHMPNMPPAVLPKKEVNEIASAPNNVTA
jgi:hypothetical protein